MEDFDGVPSQREAGRHHVFFAISFVYSWAATLLFPFGVIRPAGFLACPRQQSN
jgi:hypothetical protein